MMTEVVFDRDEERDLLDGLFAAVAFDKESDGIPAVAVDPQDDDDDGLSNSQGGKPMGDGDMSMAAQDTTSKAEQGHCPPGQHMMPDGKCMPDEQMDAGYPEHFHTVVMEGVSTGMREFAPNSLTWRDTPFAFHWQHKSSAHSGTPETVQVGLVTRVERDGATIHFYGPLDLRSPEGLDYARRLADGFARWSSVGLDESLHDSDVEYVFPAGEEPDGPPEKILFRRGRIAEITGVSVPALADAICEPTPLLVDTLAQMGVAGQDGPVTAGAVGSHESGTVDGPWDADANVGRLPSPIAMSVARRVFAWVDESRAEEGKVPKDAGRFPHHSVSADGSPGAANLTACSAGIAALHGARGGTTIPTADRKGVYNHLAAHLRDAGRTPPEFDAALVAGGYTVTIADLPPAGWFDEPADLSPFGEIRVSEQGRLWGYLAPADVGHRGFQGRRVTVPMGRVDYSGWMSKPWPVAEGHKIYVGVITMDCGHASVDPADRSYHAPREHYDNTCSIAAHARIGENRHGVWVAGALAPWITAEQLGKLMSCQLSGDWRPHQDRPGWRDFVAALLVPVPGFANRVPSASLRVADGALVASSVPLRLAATGHADTRQVLEFIARRIGRDARSRLDELHTRIHGNQ